MQQMRAIFFEATPTGFGLSELWDTHNEIITECSEIVIVSTDPITQWLTWANQKLITS